MAQTDRTNVPSQVPSSGGNFTVNRREASAAATAVPSHSLAAVPGGEDPFVTVAQAEAMDTAPDFPNQNPNASGVRACCPADLVRPVHPMRDFYVVTVGKCVGIFDSQQIGEINLVESSKFSMRKFANWDQAVGFYTAHFDANSLHIAPTIVTQEHPVRVFATQPPPAWSIPTQRFHAPPGRANTGTESHPIFVASTATTPIFVASTAGSPISVSSTASTPVVAPRNATKAKFAPRVPKGLVPHRAQSVGTPTPITRTLQPFPMPPPSPNFGKAMSPGLVASILIPDSDDEDDKGKGKYPIGSVIVIGDSDDDSALPYPSYPSQPLALPSSIPATPLKGTRQFKPLFADGYSPGDFFNAEGDPDNVAVSPSAPNADLRARQLEKIEKYMKMPLAELQARSAARRAARAPKSHVDENTASTSALPRDDNDEVDYGIQEFSAAGLQEIDAILDSLVNGA